MVLLLAACGSLLACPLCKNVITEGMAKGFNQSIILMLAVPTVVVGVISLVLWRAGKKRQSRADRTD